MPNNAVDIIDTLNALYPAPRCALEYNSPVNLLVAVILSGQCTDKRVNVVMLDLMKKYTTAWDYAGADIAELEEDIRSVGLFHAKARNIRLACKEIAERYNGIVPDNMRDLLTLPGVGRKTANVVLGELYGIPGVVVDTHVKRLAKRLGLTASDNPQRIEQDIAAVIPPEIWQRFCHQLIMHGRAVCKAQKPLCGECPLYWMCGSKLI